MSSKSKLILIAIIISVFSFIWGAGVGVYKWFPYFYVLEVKQFLISNKTKNISNNVFIDNSYIQSHINSIDAESILAKREKLIERVIPKENNVIVTREKLNDNSEKIITKLYKNKILFLYTHSE